MQRSLVRLINLSLPLVSPELGLKWWAAATLQWLNAPSMKWGWATAGFKLAQAEHPRLKVVDQMGLLNLLQGVSGVCNPPPGAAGQAICAAGRTLPEEWAATHQYG